MVDFLTQSEIQAALLTAFFTVIGWSFLQWRKSLRRCKQFENSASSPRHQLPPQPVNFIGRDKELAQLEKELVPSHLSRANTSAKHVALQGMGGVGKTALAIVLAHRLKDYFKDAHLYLNLRGADLEHSQPMQPAEAIQIIIRTLRPKIRLPEELNQLIPIYNSVLNATGRVLLFLDDAMDSEQIKPLLPPSTCMLLVTSRSQFSLPGMFSQIVDCLCPEKSQELLLKLSPRIYGHEIIIAQLCGHLPIALEVFAGMVNDKKLYAVSELLNRQSEKRQNLSPINATFQVSYELLTDNLRRRWILLSIFKVHFDLAAAAAIWEEQEDIARDAMQSLVNASLVQWNKTNNRFRLHDLARFFCDSKITEAERNTANERFAIYYRDKAVAAESFFKQGGEDIMHGLALFDLERTHIEMMFNWLLSRQDTKSASLLVSLLNTMNHTSKLRFHPHQRIHWLESQLTASYFLKDREAECKSFGHLGVAYFELGDVQKAIGFYNQTLTISRAINYRQGEAAALGSLGEAQNTLGERETAIGYFEESLTICRQIGDREGEASNLNYLGGIYKSMGNYHRATETYEHALLIGNQLGAKHIQGTVLSNLGIIYCDSDDIHRGIEYLEKSLFINREIGDRHNEGGILCSLADSFKLLGNFDKAIEYYEQGLQSLRDAGNLRGEALVLNSYAVALNELGYIDDAIAMVERSTQILEAVGDSAVDMTRKNLLRWREKLQGHRQTASLSIQNDNNSLPS